MRRSRFPIHVGSPDAWLRPTRYYTLDTVAESSSHALPHKSLVIIVTKSMSFRLARNDLSCELTETGCAASVNNESALACMVLAQSLLVLVHFCNSRLLAGICHSLHECVRTLRS